MLIRKTKISQQLISPCHQLPLPTIRTCKPPLKTRIFIIRIPSTSTIFRRTKFTGEHYTLCECFFCVIGFLTILLIIITIKLNHFDNSINSSLEYSLYLPSPNIPFYIYLKLIWRNCNISLVDYLLFGLFFGLVLFSKIITTSEGFIFVFCAS